MLAVSSAFAQSPEAKLLAVLKSDATLPEKAEACRDLASVGTKAAVAPLAALLGDEQLAHMARYGLENIPDPAAGEALRAALGQLKGRLLAGVISSLGVRRDAQAVGPLAKLLGDADSEVAAAAAMALGKIGSASAAAALKPALGKIPASAEALLRCAEAALADNRRDDAIALYDLIRAAAVPAHQKMAATRGVILARGVGGLPLLLEQLRSDNPAALKVGLGVGRELPGAEVTQALAAELGKFAPEKQSLVIQMLGDRRDVAAAPALLAIAGNGATEARIAAIRALAQTGCIAAVPLLGALANSSDAEVAKAAFAALAGFPGYQVDATIVALLNRPDARLRAIGVELIGHRHITGALSEVLRLTADADAQVSTASFKVLGEIAGPNEIPPLLAILRKTATPQAAEDALAAICARQALTAGTVVEPLLTAYARAQGPAKLALLRLLRSAGGPKALAVVRDATGSSDAALREVALRALCDWPTAEILPDLAKLAQTSQDVNFKILALRGYVRLVPLCNAAPATNAAALKQALTWCERDEERRLALAALGSVPAPEALALSATYLDNANLKEEACLAAVAIAENLAKAQPEQVADVLKRVIKTSQNSAVLKRARKVLGSIKKASQTPIEAHHA